MIDIAAMRVLDGRAIALRFENSSWILSQAPCVCKRFSLEKICQLDAESYGAAVTRCPKKQHAGQNRGHMGGYQIGN